MGDSYSESDIERLVRSRSMQSYGTFDLVSVPKEPSKLPKHFQDILLSRIREAERIPQHTVDGNSLLAALERITPPVNEEDENNKSRLIEAQARKSLRMEGCPPCYPAAYDVPLRTIPPKYQKIIQYFQSLAGTGDVVLKAQLSEWMQFCAHQEKVRAYYQRRNFTDYVNNVRERRRKHNLADGVDIPFKIDKAHPGNWLEFQDWQLLCFEGLRKSRNELKAAYLEARGTDEMTDAETYQEGLNCAERRLELYLDYIRWAEERRFEEASKVRQSPQSRVEQSKASATLAQAKIVKTKRRLLSRRLKQTNLNTRPCIDLEIPRGNILQGSGNKSRRHPLTDARTGLQSPRGLQSEVVRRTQFGRIMRKPQRYGFPPE